MKKAFLLTIFILIQGASYAKCEPGMNLKQCWEKSLELYGSGKYKNDQQSFCYIDENGEVKGQNVDKPLVIASVSKLFTTLWAMTRSEMGPEHVFKTKVYINGKNAHIEGGNDPVFTKRSLYNLINELNNKGIHDLDFLSFDKNFHFTPEAIDNKLYAQVYDDGPVHYCKYYTPNKNQTKRELTRFINTKNWSSEFINTTNAGLDKSGKCINHINRGLSIKRDYQEKRSIFPQFKSTVSLNVKNTYFNDENPFKKKDGSIIKGTKVFTFNSATLDYIIKLTNTISSNQIADSLFHFLGGSNKFKKELSTMINSKNGEENLQFISGSGLSYKRRDQGTWEVIENKATCRTVLSILEIFSSSTNKRYKPLFNAENGDFSIPSQTLSDKFANNYLAVAGAEYYSRYSNHLSSGFIAKSGTLGTSKSFVGTMNTKTGVRHFAMINNFPRGSSLKGKSNSVHYDIIDHMAKTFGLSKIENSKLGPLNQDGFKSFGNVKIEDI